MKTVKSVNRIAAVLLAAFALACLLWLLWPRLFPSPGAKASIQIDGTEYAVIDLNSAEDLVFSVAGDTGRQITFEIRDHSIRFASSDCPDQVCVRVGFIGQELETAVCMPNRTAIFITSP